MSDGLLAAFDDETGLQRALDRLHAAEIDDVETYTPHPLEETRPVSPIPVIILVAGLFGAAAGFAIQVDANALAYPLDIGGRPEFSWPAFLPISFETGVLAGIVLGLLAYFIVNRLPHLYDPVDEHPAMREASRDGWLLTIHTDDPRLIARAHTILDELDATVVEALR